MEVSTSSGLPASSPPIFELARLLLHAVAGGLGKPRLLPHAVCWGAGRPRTRDGPGIGPAVPRQEPPR